jgi:hypothetical protein
VDQARYYDERNYIFVVRFCGERSHLCCFSGLAVTTPSRGTQGDE